MELFFTWLNKILRRKSFVSLKTRSMVWLNYAWINGKNFYMKKLDSYEIKLYEIMIENTSLINRTNRNNYLNH